ncbi:EAL domain-containing protein [Janthinobacterium sp. 17J80-10]|uniref:bifunctional diguanylate cyclase/phosphodiesterase n=1 Tax=Janthinobacterium sp. 17J80-10 TaxID=2497863 RepID=UPI0013E8BCC6|nr:EAL domain-containing protein [Janthinobacterium sp. 17J80-10]
MIARLGLFTAVYILLGKISLLLAIDPSNISAVWPAAGFAVAITLKYGYRMWPAIFLGAVIFVGTTGLPPALAVAMGMGNTLEAVIASWLIKRHIALSDRFTRSGDVFRFVLFAAAGASIAGWTGATVLLASGHLQASHYLESWFTWILGDLTGIAIFAPLILTWRANAGRDWNRQAIAEIILFSLAYLLCGLFVFTLRGAPLLFLFLPFLIWLAFRFSQSEVAKANVVLVAMVTIGIINNTGPLAGAAFNPLLLLQVFVSVVGITALALAATIDERRQATHDLKKLQDELELLVQRRTAELHHAVAALENDVAAREKIQNALRAKETQLEEAQHLAHMGSWEWDAANDRMTISNEMARIYGIPPDRHASLPYKDYLTYIPAEECHLVDEVVQGALTTRQPFSYEHHVIRSDGAWRYLHCRGGVKTDAAGNPVMLYGTAHDITEEKALQAGLREAEELYRKLVELSPDAIYLLHQGRIAFSNDAGLKLAGVGSHGQLTGKNFIDLICPGDRKSVAETLHRLAHSDQAVSAVGKIGHGDGSTVDIELAATPFSTQIRQDTLLVVRDIAERKSAEQKIYHLAHHDPLTGLANRMLFKERLEHAIAQAHRTRKSLAVLFIDLDHFKIINDTAGHNAGDQVLRECAQRLHDCLRDSDTVARTGGDEFLVLVESSSDPLHVPSVAQKLLAAVEQPFHVGEKEYAIGASIGISTYPADGIQVETLVKNADIAMYRAKAEGRGRFRYYSAAMAAQSLERYAMEAALRHALDRGEMELYFQPKISLRNGRTSGAEALIRWNHPDHGLLLPHRFISLAEDMGLIAEIGLWAIGETCRHCRGWQDQGLPPIRIAVNLAYSQFTDDSFCSRVHHLLQDAGLRPDSLELELTETMLMKNAERLMDILHQLKRLGVHLSVDDFGTGYSSLAYLKRLPVDSVKVDRSFIKDLPGDSEDVAITHAVLALVHSLKRTVVAEGVETREQFEFLLENGCEEGQGFYFSPALPAGEFRQFLAAGKVFAL